MNVNDQSLWIHMKVVSGYKLKRRMQPRGVRMSRDIKWVCLELGLSSKSSRKERWLVGYTADGPSKG